VYASVTSSYYRFHFAEPREGRTAKWGALTTLYEVDDAGIPTRQLNLYQGAPYAERFDRERRPYIENAKGERFGHIREEALDLSAVATNQITREEFEFSWASGLLRERSFGEFKWELLASGMEDIQGVYEAWWSANTWYPHRPLSERLSMAVRALRELLAEGLIIGLVIPPCGRSIKALRAPGREATTGGNEIGISSPQSCPYSLTCCASTNQSRLRTSVVSSALSRRDTVAASSCPVAQDGRKGFYRPRTGLRRVDKLGP
jgi:hypothetical protein